MKKFIKFCLIAGAVCILLGGAMAVSVAVLGASLRDVVPEELFQWTEDFPEASFDKAWEDFDDDYEQMNADAGERGQEIFSSAEVKHIDIEAQAGTVFIGEQSSANRVRVYCNGNESQFELYGDGDELELKTYPGNGDESKLLFTVLVPEGYRFENVNLILSHPSLIKGRESISPVIVVKSLSSDEMNLETKTGAIQVVDGRTEALSVLCNAGAVDFSGATTGDIDVECRVGAIKMELDGKEEDYNYDTECNMGALRIGSESIAAIRGDKQVDNGAGKEMNVECKAGAVEVNFMNDL